MPYRQPMPIHIELGFWVCSTDLNEDRKEELPEFPDPTIFLPELLMKRRPWYELSLIWWHSMESLR